MDSATEHGYQRIQLTGPNPALSQVAVLKATTAKTRRQGLTGISELAEAKGLLIPAAPVVHMVGMKFPLDLVFISRSRQVVKLINNAKPGLCMYGAARAWYCLELAAGQAEQLGIANGDALSWVASEAPSSTP